MDLVFHVFLTQFWCPMVPPATAPGLACGMLLGHQPSPQMSAWRVWRYLGMMQYDLRRLGMTLRHPFSDKIDVFVEWTQTCVGSKNYSSRIHQIPMAVMWFILCHRLDLFKKNAPGFGISKVVWEHSMPSGGERQAVQRGQRWWTCGTCTSKITGAQLEHVGTIGKRSNKKHRFPRHFCCNNMEGKRTAQCLHSMLLIRGHTWDTTMKSTHWHIFGYFNIFYI